LPSVKEVLDLTATGVNGYNIISPSTERVFKEECQVNMNFALS